MIRSSRPSTLTAAKVFDLSLQGFSEVFYDVYYNHYFKIEKYISYVYARVYRFAKRQQHISISFEQ